MEYKPTQPKDGSIRETDAIQVFAQKLCADYIWKCNSEGCIYYADTRKRVKMPFDEEFTMDELARIEPKENEVMLTYNDRGLAVSGDHTHYWSATRSEVADLSESAYKYYVDDMVYIPTLDMMKTIDVRGSYWILCPYGYNDKMQRYMKNDGFILHTNVDNIDGVRAAVRIKAE